jgi:hypothetical protein
MDMRSAVLLILLPAAFAQTAARDDYLPHELSAGFRYEVKLGQNSYRLDNVPGYGVKYAYRPLRWLALEGGMEQFPRPIGASVCCRSLTNADDELFLVAFGARYVWEPRGRRFRLSAGGGGAYLKHVFSSEAVAYGLAGASSWGSQFVGGGDLALTRSGRFRAGITARYYYIELGSSRTGRVFTAGPDFTLSFPVSGRP